MSVAKKVSGRGSINKENNARVQLHFPGKFVLLQSALLFDLVAPTTGNYKGARPRLTSISPKRKQHDAQLMHDAQLRNM